jgi:tetratricopeptide (TPR) repeat protein
MSNRGNRIGWRFGPAPFELQLKEPEWRSVLTRAGTLIALTKLEMKLLVLIVKLGGKVATKDQQVEIVWDGDPVDDGSLSAAANRLKDKLGDSVIDTVWGVGQRLTCSVEPLDSPEELHARYLAALFTRAEIERQTMCDAEWDRKYAPRLDEIREMLAWSLAERGRRMIAIDLFGATARLFERLGLLTEARDYVDRVVALLDGDVPPESEACLMRFGGILWREDDHPRSLEMFQRSLALYRQLDDASDSDIGALLGLIGGVQVYLGKYDDAQENLEQSVKILSKTGLKKNLWNTFNSLGSLCEIRNMPKEAKNYFDHAVDIAVSLDDTLRKNLVVVNIAEMEFNYGIADRALIRCEEAAEGLQAAPRAYRVRPLVNLATYHAVLGNFREAFLYVGQALPLTTDDGGYWRRLCLQVWAFLAVQCGLFAHGARMIGFVDHQLLRFGEVRQKPEQRLYDQLSESLRAGLSQDSIEVWASEGARWTEAQAREFVDRHVLSIP